MLRTPVIVLAIKSNDFERGQQLLQPKPKVILIPMGTGIQQNFFVVQVAPDEDVRIKRSGICYGQKLGVVVSLN